jgi:hypothetical protein
MVPSAPEFSYTHIPFPHMVLEGIFPGWPDWFFSEGSPDVQIRPHLALDGAILIAKVHGIVQMAISGPERPGKK